MGFGDDIMATGIARAIKEQHTEAKFVFGDPDTYHDPGANKLSVHWSEVFENNPNIVQPDEPVKTLACIPDYPGCRLYIDYEKSESKDGKWMRFHWREDYAAPKGEFFFTDNEKSEAGEIALRLPKPFFIIEPNVADKPWINQKSWPVDRWQEVVDALRGEVSFVQFDGPHKLKGAHCVMTPSFRQAAAILSCAGAFVGTDGGLHHAAAALDIPAVVLWGHYASPDILGYTDHSNLRHSEGAGCGNTWNECPECSVSMGKITTEEVVEAIKGLMNNGRHIVSRKGNKGSVFRMVGASTKGGQK